MKNTIQHYQEIFTERFNKINFVKFPHELYEPIDYALRAGGKRLRPVLTIMICDFYGNNIEDAMNPAIAIETGYLTNPETENRLNDPAFLRDAARLIKKGIDVYLSR